jgi:coenzyme F420-reducing hydrogenase delta subunit
MYNISAAMANQFVEAVKEMTETIMGLGPNPLRESSNNPDTGSKEQRT